jgi:hypothetical protein
MAPFKCDKRTLVSPSARFLNGSRVPLYRSRDSSGVVQVHVIFLYRVREWRSSNATKEQNALGLLVAGIRGGREGIV